jgi:hypothetical protein
VVSLRRVDGGGRVSPRDPCDVITVVQKESVAAPADVKCAVTRWCEKEFRAFIAALVPGKGPPLGIAVDREQRWR